MKILGINVWLVLAAWFVLFVIWLSSVFVLIDEIKSTGLKNITMEVWCGDKGCD